MDFKTFLPKKASYPYLIKNRLSDIIRLISVLAVVDSSFRTEWGINDHLRGNPQSANKWLEIAKDHPEFFRLNKEQNQTILLLRFLLQPEIGKNHKRAPLDIEQTQKLIGQAISLHDKQLSNYQKNYYLIPIVVALISSIFSLGIALRSPKSTSIDNEIKAISAKLDTLNYKLKNSPPQPQLLKTPKSNSQAQQSHP